MYQYTLQSSDTATLYKVGPEILEKIAKIPGLRDVTSDLYVNNPQMTLQIDREAAAVYGVTQDQIRRSSMTASAAGRWRRCTPRLTTIT
jgi:HAE1 family hydrophobic/amphiphilic exporter-1